jgi:hypothetical protein
MPRNAYPFKRVFAANVLNDETYEFDFMPLIESSMSLANSYKQLALAGVAAVLRGESSVLELYKPIAFNFRHSLECGLKAIIHEGIKHPILTASPLPAKVPITHELDQLWRIAKEVIVGCGLGDTTKDALVDEVVAEWNSVDPGGDGARYTTDSQGRQSMANAPLRVGLLTLRDAMVEAIDYLDSVDIGLGGKWECENPFDQ